MRSPKGSRDAGSWRRSAPCCSVPWRHLVSFNALRCCRCQCCCHDGSFCYSRMIHYWRLDARPVRRPPCSPRLDRLHPPPHPLTAPLHPQAFPIPLNRLPLHAAPYSSFRRRSHNLVFSGPCRQPLPPAPSTEAVRHIQTRPCLGQQAAIRSYRLRLEVYSNTRLSTTGPVQHFTEEDYES